MGIALLDNLATRKKEKSDLSELPIPINYIGTFIFATLFINSKKKKLGNKNMI